MSESVALPPRPALPHALWALLAALAAERAALALAPGAAALAAASAVLAALALALARPGRAALALPLAAVLLASLAASGLSCAAELSRQAALAQALSTSSVSSWELRLVGDMSRGANAWRGRAVASCAGGPAGEVWLLADEPLEQGTRLSCVGRFEPNGDDDWGASSRAQGICGTVRAVRALSAEPAGGLSGAVLALRSAVLASLDAGSSDERALLAGSVCGSMAAISERGLDDAFARCGVSHLVAVSGGHLALVCALVAAPLGRFRLGPAGRAAALLALTGLFVAFCGAPASAVRSWAMSLVAALARLLGRRAHPLSSVSLASLAMALADPGVTGQLGYLLSVACVCGICALGGYARYLVRVLLPAPRLPAALPARARAALCRLGSEATDALALTLVSQAVTMPLTCAAFSQLSLVAPLANVLLAPLFTPFLGAGLVAACLAWAPALQAPALLAADALGGAIVRLVGLLGGLPLASVAVSVEEGPALAAMLAASGALLVWWPRASRRAIAAALGLAVAAALAWLLRWRLLAPARVVVMDVGQGDAILVTDGAASLLVDTGPGDAVVAALARAGVTHLDAVLLTHLHDDHAGGLADVLGAVSVGRVIVGEGAEPGAAAGGLPVEWVGHGDALAVGRFSLEVVSPLEPADGSGNEGSLELLVAFRDGGRELTALLAADAEEPETSAALARGDVGDVDLLKVGHHGSAASVGMETARALDPEVSVASAGEGNSYGHPDPACVEALEGAGSLFLCTIECGDVTVEPGESGPVVTCQKGGMP
ncbi:ComEC/Rec2 family competence protein [Olsenella uli]|uniref:ComEC/Rec2 family competence protein n=1 Tax=Olsenella uli TaxID=133926 RepID=UPI0019593057|nr:ComEC/Rec2 family competence protein [Olsenella uli]